jgi:hypothetical protein
MRNMLTASVGIAVLLIAAAALLTPADAGQGGGVDACDGGHVTYRAAATPYQGR